MSSSTVQSHSLMSQLKSTAGKMLESVVHCQEPVAPAVPVPVVPVPVVPATVVLSNKLADTKPVLAKPVLSNKLADPKPLYVNSNKK